MIQMKSRCFAFVLSTLVVLPLAGCGKAAGVPTQAEAALPDEPGTEPALGENEAATPNALATEETVATAGSPAAQAILAKYGYLDPKHQVPDALLEKAVLYYDANLAHIQNKSYLSVVDFSDRSTKARFFIVDMKSGKVWAIHVAHGKGSDPNHDGYATAFSNRSGSNMSALGVYKTAETYSGKHGLSLRLDGLSSTNSNVRAREIVIHGANYVEESSVIQGRSLGCLAVAMENRNKVISMLKGGSIIFAGLEK